MANPEHVDVVKRGANAIAQWNAEHAEIGGMLGHEHEAMDLRRADLSGDDLRRRDPDTAFGEITDWSGTHLRLHLDEADLIAADLREANLSGVMLRDADLIAAKLAGATLWNACLTETDLSRARLCGADLSAAELNDAILRDSDLREADLRTAELMGADLTGSRLDGADFGGALFGHTILGNVDLSNVQGLETVTHRFPSTMGVDTLFLSKGKIPESFLRGCGLPDVLIDYLPSLIGAMQPVQFYSCFLSHSSKDEQFCRRLHSRLRDEKLRIWYAPEDLKGGEKLFDQIDHAIRVYDKVLLVLSKHSIGSNWVETEIRLAREKERAQNRRVLFPISLVDFGILRDWTCFDADTGRDMAVEVREYFIPDFSNWSDQEQFEAAFARLMSDLSAEAR